MNTERPIYEDLHVRDNECRPCPPYVETPKLARAYVPIQKICEIYSADSALMAGTAFPELNMPYRPNR